MTAGDTDALGRAAAAQLETLSAKPLVPGLYVVATPIGNLSDITLRALHVLANADTVYCEDTRQTRKLMERYALRPRLKAYHEHNAEKERPRVLEDLSQGGAIALVSDAGTPLVSDPGHKLVRDAREARVAIHAIPGPSAVLTGLVASGLNIDRFFFEGFLPPKSSARRDRIAKLAAIPGALIFYEAPGRLPSTLTDLAAVLGDRPAAVMRELTKLHEEHRVSALPELSDRYSGEKVRGEIVIVVGPPSAAAEVTDAELREGLTRLLDTMSLRDVSRELAQHFDVPRKRVYDIGLGLSRDSGTTGA